VKGLVSIIQSISAHTVINNVTGQKDDQLMQACWTGILPVVIALIILVPSLLVAFDIAPY